MSKIYIVCPVTIATKDDLARLDAHVAMQEDEGNVVYYPGRDTNQEADIFSIMTQNSAAIIEADEIHVFYRSESKGSMFDLGVAFAADIMRLGSDKVFKIIDTDKEKDKRYSGQLPVFFEKWEELSSE